MDLTIFCTQCDTLLLDAPKCPACGWRRPPPAEVGTQVWQYNAGAKLGCTSLALAGDRLYFGDAGHPGQPGSVHALDAASGEVVWCAPLPQDAPSDSLATGSDRVYTSATEAGGLSPDKALLALDADTGDLAWTYQTGALNLSAPLLHNQIVYAVGSDRKLHAVDAVSGKRVWMAGIAGWGRAAPAAGGGLLFMGTEQNRLLALDLSDGRQRWSHSGQGWFAATPSIHEGVVYAACWDGTLYALELDSGKLVWRFELGPHAYLLTSPVVSGERVFVGSRDHCLYAVDRHSGEGVWRFETGRRVYASPAVAQGLVYLGSDDSHLYALDEESGELRWQIDLPDRCRTAPLLAQQRLYVACQGGEVLALSVGEEEAVEDPQIYLDQEEYAKAAAALALTGEFKEAARIYADRLDEPNHAAQLYEQAGDAMRAARQYEQARQKEQALEQWRAMGKVEAVARILQDLGRPLEAAEALEEAGQLLAAAELYEKVLEQPAKAADLYRQAGKLGRALSCYVKVRDVGNEIGVLIAMDRSEDAARRYEEVGEYVRAAELYVQVDEPALAAAMWAKQGEHRKAAELYAKVGERAEAAAQYEQARAWQKAAGLYLDLDQSLKAAHCLEEGKEFSRAGALYEQEALRLEEESGGKAEERLADLFERAAICFDREYERDRCDRCHQKIRYYRHQPVLALMLKQEEAFVKGSYNYLTMDLINNGRGIADKVEVTLVPVPATGKNFAGELTKSIQGIGRFGSHKDTLAVRPLASGKLSLDVQLVYHDRKGQAFEDSKRWFVDVKDEVGSGQFTPQEIHIHQGDYIAGEKIGGDYLAEGSQKGDKVEISRGGPAGVKVTDLAEAGLRCQACGARQASGAAYCEQCGVKLEGSQ